MARTVQIIVQKRTFMVALDGALVFISRERAGKEGGKASSKKCRRD
jgi:hypothetical protein